MALFVSGSCGSKGGGTAPAQAPAATGMPDTLRVGTLYSPTTYFMYKDEPMGYEYDMVKQFAQSRNLPMEVVVAPNFSALIELLRSGGVDILACQVPVTSEYKDSLLYCGPENITTQVLVQPRSKGGKPLIDDVTKLIGKKVYVERDSKYFYRMENLNEEIGGGIHIEPVEGDSLVTRDLVEMVANGTLPLTIVDSDIAALEATYYPSIDVSLPVSLEQKSKWAVSTANSTLAKAVDDWAAGISADKEVLRIHRHYFEESKSRKFDDESDESTSPGGRHGAPMALGGGKISQYDTLFKKYAPNIGWDWRLLAAIAYQESRFDNSVVSWAGARGIMQIMPRTAARNGLSEAEITNPERNVQTAVKILSTLDGMFAGKVESESERLKFVLASYNAGQGHVYDAMALAAKYGKSPKVWQNNVRDAVLMKSKPEYYNDPVVKHGYFRGTQTVEYVDNVLSTFDYYKNNVVI